MTMLMTNYDDIAWQSIHCRPPSKSNDKGLGSPGRPKDYMEITQMLERGTTGS